MNPRRPLADGAVRRGHPGESETTAERFRDWLVDEKGFPMTGSRSSPPSRRAAKGDLWQVREGGLGATAFPPDGQDHWPGWEDSAVPPERIGATSDLRALYKYGLSAAAFYGHFGQGCIHWRIDFDLRTAQGIAKYRASWRRRPTVRVATADRSRVSTAMASRARNCSSSSTAEELVGGVAEFKRIWDPDWKMNPGKVVDPYRLDENLRLGAD